MSYSILYYPTINFQKKDYDWLTRASLFWDNIYRIVPEKHAYQDDDFVQELSSTGEIGRPYIMDYRDTIHIKFAACSKYLQDNRYLFKTYKEKYSIDKVETVRLYKSKALWQLFSELAEYELIINNVKGIYSDSYEIPKEIADTYMSYLAREIADKEQMSLSTQDSAAWMASSRIENAQGREKYLDNENHYIAFPIYIYDLVPMSAQITPKKILKFRKERADERHNFMQTLESFLKELSNVQSIQRLTDVWNDECKVMLKAITDYKKSTDILGAVEWGGTMAALGTIAVDVASIASGNNPLLPYLGLGFGGLGVITELINKRYPKSAHPYSYLYQVRELVPAAQRKYPFTINPMN